MKQQSIFDCLYPSYRIEKPIRLIELFAGVGSQAMALRDLGADFKRYRVIEIDPFAIKSYNAIHGTSFEPSDITHVAKNVPHLSDDVVVLSTRDTVPVERSRVLKEVVRK